MENLVEMCNQALVVVSREIECAINTINRQIFAANVSTIVSISLAIFSFMNFSILMLLASGILFLNRLELVVAIDSKVDKWKDMYSFLPKLPFKGGEAVLYIFRNPVVLST